MDPIIDTAVTGPPSASIAMSLKGFVAAGKVSVRIAGANTHGRPFVPDARHRKAPRGDRI